MVITSLGDVAGIASSTVGGKFGSVDSTLVSAAVKQLVTALTTVLNNLASKASTVSSLPIIGSSIAAAITNLDDVVIVSV